MSFISCLSIFFTTLNNTETKIYMNQTREGRLFRVCSFGTKQAVMWQTLLVSQLKVNKVSRRVKPV